MPEPDLDFPRAGPMSTQAPRPLLHRVFASSWTWWMLITIYVGITLFVLAPVLLASVGADDSYWLLELPPPNPQGDY